MGYYTRYELTFDEFSEDNMAMCPKCHGRGKILQKDLVQAALKDTLWYEYNIVEGEAAKWYSHEDDMKKISKQFPGILFTLSGSGEEAADHWVKYFYKGEVQSHHLVAQFPPFERPDDG